MNKINYLDVIISPNVTEKSTSLSEFNKVVFKVRKDVSKKLIKKSIEIIERYDAWWSTYGVPTEG